MENIYQALSLINLIFLVCGSIGGYFAFRHSARIGTVNIQHDTIEALQARVETLEGEIESLKKENTRKDYILETIQEALRQRGILVTISGDLVTLTDANGSTHVVKSPPSRANTARLTRPRKPVQRKKETGDLS